MYPQDWEFASAFNHQWEEIKRKENSPAANSAVENPLGLRHYAPTSGPKTQILPALPQDPAHGFSPGFDTLLADECATFIQRLSTSIRWTDLFGKKGGLPEGIKAANQATAFARMLQDAQPGIFDPTEQELLVPLISLLCPIYEQKLKKLCPKTFGYSLERCLLNMEKHASYIKRSNTGDYPNNGHYNFCQRQISKFRSLVSLEAEAELLREEKLPESLVQTAILAVREIVLGQLSPGILGEENIDAGLERCRAFTLVTLVQQINTLKGDLSKGSLYQRIEKCMQQADLLCMQRVKWPALHRRGVPVGVRVGSALSRAQIKMQGRNLMLRLAEAHDGSVEAYEFREQHSTTFEKLLRAAECLGINFEVRFNCDQRIFPAEEKRWECLETFVRMKDRAAASQPAS